MIVTDTAVIDLIWNCARRNRPWCCSPKGTVTYLPLPGCALAFHGPWRNVGISDRVGAMVKMAEAANGKVLEDGSVEKPVTEEDQERLRKACDEVRELMSKAGVQAPYIDGLLHGGHLGGTVPLRKEDVESMHPFMLPEGLWVADLSLLPRSQGLPTILTTAALALRVSRKMAE